MESLHLRVTITRYTSEDQPGWVECRLLDAFGREWLFEDKLPIFSAEDGIGFHTSFPKEGMIRCEVLNRRRNNAGAEIVTVDTELPDHVAARTGETKFDVRPDQIASVTRD